MSKIRDFTTSYNQKNIVGPVGQSGGVPTGAIIESGSNSNGRYIKYADGTMICTTSKVVNIFSSIGPYNFVVINDGAATWNWPVAFAATPVMEYSIICGYSYAFKVTSELLTSTGFGNFHLSNVWNATLTPGVTAVYVTGIGRWF